eukprot:gene12142-6323_t
MRAHAVLLFAPAAAARAVALTPRAALATSRYMQWEDCRGMVPGTCRPLWYLQCSGVPAGGPVSMLPVDHFQMTPHFYRDATVGLELLFDHAPPLHASRLSLAFDAVGYAIQERFGMCNNSASNVTLLAELLPAAPPGAA